MNAMKRLIAFALIACLILCGCGKKDTTPTKAVNKTQTITEPTKESTSTTEPTKESIPTTEPPTQPVTEPTQPKVEKVTVYLLTKTTVFDSGYIDYHYDENFNIHSFKVFSIENETMYESFFDKKDTNGMACEIRSHWPDGAGNETLSLTYSEDGNLTDELIADSNFSGFQYAYDQNGNRTEKREYYEGMLESVVYYEYEGNLLKAVYCNDNADNRVYECRVEKGLITEKNYFDSEIKYGYRYQYDENKNLVSTIFYYDGEDMPGDQYFYQAVEVDAVRANYLQKQQRYLISIT
jgi:YD repeat-containing protein